ncbi:MAG: T9SS type A sorting domain-containing protein [Flavobacteriales bacterium]|nr:T9SS type A sorting domain-containing protein [Flavobacteriales bacterium]
MKHLILFLALLSAHGLRAQVLISDSLISSFTIAELADQGIAGADNDIETYRIVYHTVDPFGQPTVASAAVALPVNTPCTHAMAAYMHGTVLNREGVPSRLSDEIVVAYYLSAFRYVAVLPDYLGLGDSPGPHPYMHAASEATAGRDALRAARELCATKGVELNGQLFLTGYSQGGHACMATHKLLQESHADEFTVTAAAPCSGPYDASGVQAEVIIADEPYPAPYYLPYVLLSYGYVYPWLYDEVSEVVQEPWATELPPLFQGNNGSGVVDDIMPGIPNQILVPTMLQAFIDDPDHPFRQALRDNDLYDWTPQSRLRMFYCDADDHVFFQNSIVARDAMQANGAPDVQAVSAGVGLDHNGCAFPALLLAKGVFDALQWPCGGIGIAEQENDRWSIAPNPASDLVRISRAAPDGTASFRLIASDGRSLLHGVMPDGASGSWIDASSVPPGLYLIELVDHRGRAALRVAVER